jgi:uncharacterized membrane protein YgcG
MADLSRHSTIDGYASIVDGKWEGYLPFGSEEASEGKVNEGFVDSEAVLTHAEKTMSDWRKLVPQHEPLCVDAQQRCQQYCTKEDQSFAEDLLNRHWQAELPSGLYSMGQVAVKFPFDETYEGDKKERTFTVKVGGSMIAQSMLTYMRRDLEKGGMSQAVWRAEVKRDEAKMDDRKKWRSTHNAFERKIYSSLVLSDDFSEPTPAVFVPLNAQTSMLVPKHEGRIEPDKMRLFEDPTVAIKRKKAQPNDAFTKFRFKKYKQNFGPMEPKTEYEIKYGDPTSVFTLDDAFQGLKNKANWPIKIMDDKMKEIKSRRKAKLKLPAGRLEPDRNYAVKLMDTTTTEVTFKKMKEIKKKKKFVNVRGRNLEKDMDPIIEMVLGKNLTRFPMEEVEGAEFSVVWKGMQCFRQNQRVAVPQPDQSVLAGTVVSLSETSYTVKMDKDGKSVAVDVLQRVILPCETCSYEPGVQITAFYKQQWRDATVLKCVKPELALYELDFAIPEEKNPDQEENGNAKKTKKHYPSLALNAANHFETVVKSSEYDRSFAEYVENLHRRTARVRCPVTRHSLKMADLLRIRLKKLRPGGRARISISGESLLVVGSRVRVTKEGSHTNKEGEVIEPQWLGRVQINLEGETKSYTLDELELIEDPLCGEAPVADGENEGGDDGEVPVGTATGTEPSEKQFEGVVDIAGYLACPGDAFAKKAEACDEASAKQLVAFAWEPAEGQRRPVLLSGHEGSGKSWTLTQLEWELSSPHRRDHRCVPVRVSVAQIAQDFRRQIRRASDIPPKLTLEWLLTDVIAPSEWPEGRRQAWISMFKQAFRLRWAVIIFDGLECAGTVSNQLVGFIHDLVRGGYQVVVATRPYLFGPDAPPGSALHQLASDSLNVELQYLSPDEQQSMLTQQYKHMAHDPEAKFFPNLFRFIAQRQEMDTLYNTNFPTRRVEGVVEVLNGDALQYEMKTADAEQLIETQRGLYALAFQAKPIFDKCMRGIMGKLGLDDKTHLLLADVKGTVEGCVVRNKELIKMVPRVMHKAEHFDKVIEKGNLRGNGMAHVDDVVRATALGNNEGDIIKIIKEVRNNKKLEIVRLRNHFREDRLTPTHYRRLDMTVRLTLDATAGLTHVCELIVTTVTIKDNEPPSQLYDYFRALLHEEQAAGSQTGSGGGGISSISSSSGDGGGSGGGATATMGGGAFMSESAEWSVFQRRMKLLQRVVQVPMLMSLLIVAMTGKRAGSADNAGNEDEDEEGLSGVEVPVMPASEAATYSLAISNLIARTKPEHPAKVRTALQQVSAFTHAEQLNTVSEEELGKKLGGTQVLLWWQRLYSSPGGDVGTGDRERAAAIGGGQALDHSLRTRETYAGQGATRRTAWGGGEIPCFEIDNGRGPLQFRGRHRLLQEHLTAEAFVDFLATRQRRADFNTTLFGWFEGSEARASILNDGGYAHVLHLASVLEVTETAEAVKPGTMISSSRSEAKRSVPISACMFDKGKMVLSDCGLTDGGVQRIACFFDHAVLELDLSSNSLGGATAFTLAKALEDRRLPALKTLVLRDNKLGELTLPAGWTHHRDAAPPWLYQHVDGGRSPTPPPGSAPSDLVTLAASLRKVTSLVNVDLRSNTTDVEGCRKLTSGCASAFIQAITMNNLGKFCEIPVWSLSREMITDLDLSSNGLGPFEASVLAHFLSNQNALVKLDVSRNCLGPEGALSLVKPFKSNRTLRYVNVLGNTFGVVQARKLIALLEPSTGKGRKPAALATCCGVRNQLKLSFAGYGLEAPCMRVLAMELKANQVLLSLDLSDNNLGSEGTKHLATVLRRDLNTLKHLDLSRNAITGNGAKHLAEALPQAGALTELKLAGNIFGTWGATLLARALSQKAHLEVLTFGDSTQPFTMCSKDKTASIGTGFDMASIILFGGFISKCKQLVRLEVAPRLLAVDVAAQLAKDIAERMAQIETIRFNKAAATGAADALSLRSAGPPNAMVGRQAVTVKSTSISLTVSVAGGTSGGSSGFGAQGALLLAAFLPRCAASLTSVCFRGDGGKSGAEGDEVSVNTKTSAALDLSSAKVGSSGTLLMGGLLGMCRNITALDLSGNNLVGVRWDESICQYQPVFDGVKALGEAIKKSTTLTQLDLSHSVDISGDMEFDQGPEFASIIYSAMRGNNSITVVNMLHNGMGMRQAMRFAGLIGLKEKLASVGGLDWKNQRSVDIDQGLGIGIVGAETASADGNGDDADGVLGAGLGALLPAGRSGGRGQGRSTSLRVDDVALLTADVTSGQQKVEERKLTELKLTYGGTDGVPFDAFKKVCNLKGIALSASAPNVIAPPKKGKKR